MKRFSASIAIITLLFCFINTVAAEESVSKGIKGDRVSISIGANAGYLSGETIYRITFPLYEEGFTIGKSELKFPLDSWIGGLNASVGRRDIWSIDLSLSKNLTEDTGRMNDSDWVTYSPTLETVKWVNADADTEMDAFLLDINGRYYFMRWEHTSLGIIAGYRYQDLSFDISNASIESPPGWFPPMDIPGKVLTYDITYKIPYGGLTYDLKASEKFTLNLQGLYGNAYAEDEDDHILRSKRATAESDGQFYSLKAEGSLSISRRLSISMSLEYLKIDTDGPQTQTWYATTEEAPAGTTLTGIDYVAESEQLYFLAAIRLTF